MRDAVLSPSHLTLGEGGTLQEGEAQLMMGRMIPLLQVSAVGRYIYMYRDVHYSKPMRLLHRFSF